MRLTTKGRSAVVAMIEVAMHRRFGPISLAVISERQRLSISYLEMLFADLRRNGLVESTRGPGGGYTLGRDIAAISVAHIVDAVDHARAEPASGHEGRTRPSSDNSQRCLTPELWTTLGQRVHEFLDSVSLQQLVDEQIAQGVEVRRSKGASPRTAAPVARALASRPNAPNSVFELGRFSIG
jgi:Rrf2 family iron-sulfur cluster assembly transcriptional regulator